MPMQKLWRQVALAAVLFGSSHGAFAAFAIHYQATDIADTTVGQDLWQYRYFVSGGFSTFFEFQVVFESQKTLDIAANPIAPHPDWYVSTIPPLPNVPSDGLYSALALVQNPFLADPFDITFVWAGPGTPGAQAFSILNTNVGDPDSGLVTIGTTQLAPIPEPYTYTLLALGLMLIVGRTRSAKLLR